MSESMQGRPFFSLRWKVFINLMLVLALVHFVYGYYSYQQLRERAAREQAQATANDVRVLQGLVAASYDRLLEVGEILPLLSLGGESVNGEGDYSQVLARHLPNLMLTGLFDALYLYDDHGRPLYRTGVDIRLPSAVVQSVATTEYPAKYLHCVAECMRFMAFPVRLDSTRMGVMAIGREMHDIVLEFKAQSGRDIGLVLQLQDSGQESLQVRYLTDKAYNDVLIRQLFQQGDIAPQGGDYELEHRGRRYHIVLSTPEGAAPGSSYWVLIRDFTDNYVAARDELIKRSVVGGIGLLLAVFFQLVILRSPLRTLAAITQVLPLLAESSFQEVRKRLGVINRKGRYEDELDLLKVSTEELSNQLERLEISLLERAENLTERSEQLEAERDFVTNLLDTAQTIILTQNADGEIVTLNQYGQTLLGVNPTQSGKLYFLDLKHAQRSLAEHRYQLDSLLNRESDRVQLEASIRSGNGQMLQISWLHSLLNTPGKEAQILTIGLDLTERKKAEKRLIWMANHDPLTALPNRLLFNEKVNDAIRLCDSTENSRLAVLFCDLDAFKDVNDSLGHPVGDELLQQAAERIQHLLEPDDLLARLGGDEFTVLLETPESPRAVEHLAQNIVRAFRQPFLIDGYEIFSTASVGIAFFPEHGRDSTSLVQHADVAMFDAKENGKNQLKIYHDTQGSQRYERFSLVNDLRRALEKDELTLLYQPQINTRNGSVMGVEALLRWHHSEAGMISPAKFIPLAEEQGLIVPIGEWVLEQACIAGRKWHDQGLDLRIGVNLAGQQIMHESLLPAVRRVLLSTGFDPAHLDLEVTENFLLRQPEITIPKLHKLRKMGLSLSMDDFGTGFSSLSYLKKLPVNTLKIDQGFVRDIGVDAEGEAIVKAIIVLARSLGLEVLAEGVETSEQLSYLRSHGCHLIQGFYFSKPLRADELPGFVTNQAVEISFDKL